MMLRAGQMQSVGKFQPEMSAELCGMQIDGFGHVEQSELAEHLKIVLLEDGVAALQRPDQTLAFDQRRNGEAERSFLLDQTSDRFSPSGVLLDQIDYQATIEVDHSQAARSSSM